MSIYLVGYVAIYLYMQFTAVFRSFGDPIFQTKGMLMTTIFNAVLDPILSCAVPAAVQGCMPAISSATMLFLVTQYGVTTIAAYGVTNKLEILLFYPAMAMNMGLTTIAGQCFGARRIDRVHDYLKTALGMGCVFTAIITAGVMFFAGQLSGMFVDSTAAADIVKGFFHIVSIGYVMYMVTSCFLGIISGFGKPGLSMFLFFVYYIVIRIPMAVLLVRTRLGLNGIWIAILVSHVAAAMVAGLFEYVASYRQRKSM